MQSGQKSKAETEESLIAHWAERTVGRLKKGSTMGRTRTERDLKRLQSCNENDQQLIQRKTTVQSRQRSESKLED
jgi:hypothetical protein